MHLTDQIARLIEEMLNEGNGQADVKRNDLAARLGCVPSQINYVITSRFTPERGYTVESRRGGGGYIRIVRVPMSKNAYLMHFFQVIGRNVEENEARAYVQNLVDAGILSGREAALAMSVMGGSAMEKIPPELRTAVRADMLRRMLLTLML